MHRSRDDGLSLIELMVAMAIGGIVVAIGFAFLVRSMSTEKFTDEESQSMAELRVAAARFTREIRQARLVYLDPARTGPSSVYVWVDTDRDNQRDAAERITWRIEGSTLVRATDAGASAVIATGLEPASGFAYDPPAAPTTVTATFVVDRAPGYAGPREVVTEVNLRNASLE